MDLLSKTRRLNRLLQVSGGDPLSFREMAEVLTDAVHSNVYVVSRGGRILGRGLQFSDALDMPSPTDENGKLSADQLKALTGYEATTSNLQGLLWSAGSAGHPDLETIDAGVATPWQAYTTVVPILGPGERLGTLVLHRPTNIFTDEDLILAEYAAAVVGMEILRARADEREQVSRAQAGAAVAMGTLSYSELDAVRRVFEAIEGRQGLLVASKIADRAGITRSVIVNALRKLESAGVIETRSLGMKGTHIRILNGFFLEALEQSESNG